MSASWQSQTLSNGVHAFTGGQGESVVLLAGWPETAEAWSEVYPPLADKYKIFALDPPGLGESTPSSTGYDTAAISMIMASAMHNELKDQAYRLVGHDIGAWIAYAWAAQYPDKIKSLTILDVRIPGLAPTLPFPLPAPANKNLFQFSFNALPDLPEIQTLGKEREFLSWFINTKLHKPEKCPAGKLDLYITKYSRPGVMTNGFNYYRAVAESSKQNVEFAKTPLSMPVLAYGGALTAGASMVPLAKTFASNVTGGVIEECGHFIAEEQPEALVQKLLSFFAVSG